MRQTHKGGNELLASKGWLSLLPEQLNMALTRIGLSDGLRGSPERHFVFQFP